MPTMDERMAGAYRSILERRGVPPQFIDAIATRKIPSLWWLWTLVGFWIAITTLLMRLDDGNALNVLNFIYLGEAATSDLFIPGVSFVWFVVLAGVCIYYFPMWVALIVSVRPADTDPGSKRSLDDAAKRLRSFGGIKSGLKIVADPRLASMSSLPTTDAFLTSVAMSDAERTRAFSAKIRMVLLGIALMTSFLLISLYVISGTDYTRITRSTIFYRHFGEIYDIPLSRVDAVSVTCEYIPATQHTSGRWSETYSVRFNGVTKDLFAADNPHHPLSHAQDLSDILAIDTYVRANLGTVHKLSPEAAAKCIETWRDKDQVERSQLRQILTA